MFLGYILVVLQIFCSSYLCCMYVRMYVCIIIIIIIQLYTEYLQLYT